MEFLQKMKSMQYPGCENKVFLGATGTKGMMVRRYND